MRPTLALCFFVVLPFFPGQDRTAEQILDRYISITGGELAYRAATGEAAEGEGVLPNGLKMKIATFTSTDGQMYMNMEIPGVMKMERGLSAGAGWEITAASGARLLEGGDLLDLQDSARLFSAALWRPYFAKVEWDGRETVAGKKCDRIKLYEKNGDVVRRWIDHDSGLLVRYETINREGGVKKVSTMSLHEYKTVDGIYAPTRMLMEDGDAKGMTIRLYKLAYREQIPASRFGIPEAVKKLASAQTRGRALPNAVDLFERHLRQVGGIAALEQAAHQRTTGTFEMPAANMKGTITAYRDGAGRSVEIIEIPESGKFESVNTGDVLWTRSTVEGPKVIAVADKPGALARPNPTSAHFWQAISSKMQTRGFDSAGGAPCYKVDVTLKDGGKLTLCFDEASGFMTKLDTAGSAGVLPQSLVFGDYRPVGAVKLPFLLETRGAGGRDFRIVAEAVTLDDPAPIEMSILPAEIKELADRKRTGQTALPPKQ